ncbi:MAG: glycosyltransferase family 39 protein [bacterium]|nr:glycosyltransferase family 39 protein [bacterium]
MKKWIPAILFTCMLLFGFWYRLYGILNNQSFWSDEALLSSFARDIVLGQKSIIQGIQSVWYESFHILTIATSFKLLGISEFSARLPSVIFGSIEIFFAFFLAKKLSNTYGGILAAFIFSFSQLNLANSTQAKPYIALQLFLLIEFYLLSKLHSKSSFWIHIGIIICILLSTLFHIYGLLFILPYFILLLFQKQIRLLIIYTLFCIGIVFAIFKFFPAYYLSYVSNIWFNHTVLLKNLLLKQYGIFLLPSILTFFVISKKQKYIFLSFIAYLIVILFFWNFRSYSHNIRYLVPIFGLIFVFFGVFWGRVGEYLNQTLKIPGAQLLPIIVAILIYASGYKIARFPQSFYSPNTDFYGDIQIADYKTMYSLIKKQVPDYKEITVFNDIFDAQRWYMPEKKIDTYFMKGTIKPYKHGVEVGYIFGSLNDFLKEKEKYSKGILIVEDWESFLPEDIKQYAKKNMKRIIRVEGLKEAPNDPWPLEVYEWGLN